MPLFNKSSIKSTPGDSLGSRTKNVTSTPITRLELCEQDKKVMSGDSDPLDDEVKEVLDKCGLLNNETMCRFSEHKITASILHSLNDCDLKELGIHKIGDRKKIISLLKLQVESTSSNRSISGSSTTSSSLNQTLPNLFEKTDPVKVSLLRLLISALYAFLAVGVTSFVMVLVHERVPVTSKYPPLPDIILDNIPYINWAFEATECVGLILLIIWCLVLIFHKHRFILIRRQFSLFGTIFLLRSVTMYITSLSVPGRHLEAECKPYVFHSLTDRLSRAFEIWFGFGMTIRGVRTCGDYIFSGHASCLTLLNFCITEYTPRCFISLHIFSWILNAFGVFFILAAHEHYSIDIFIAIYITSRLFLYYHTLANNSQFMLDAHNNQRTAIWFPLFHFFEGDVRGVVPNEFENPLRYASLQQFIYEGSQEIFVKHRTEKKLF
ncbi:hypothetical protein Ciccas_005398 [Cichlidogyrus casuarinus]|uniref:SAM domain-containing protein n=1 Tax=Cichlidogyrus casuarinus TaxID=1844966 RepID=A0ABD2Q8S4_9PLAT